MQYFVTTVLPGYCDNGYCDKLLIVTVLRTIQATKWQFYTVKSWVIVTFACCDTFPWSQQCHNKRPWTLLHFRGRVPFWVQIESQKLLHRPCLCMSIWPLPSLLSCSSLCKGKSETAYEIVTKCLLTIICDLQRSEHAHGRSVGCRPGIFSLKHEGSIFRSFIQPCMWFWKCQASSLWDKQYRA